MSIRLNEKEIKIALAGVNRKALSSSVFASAPTHGRTQNLLLHAQDRKHTQLSCRINSSSPAQLLHPIIFINYLPCYKIALCLFM